jgi:hypothetical protein
MLESPEEISSESVIRRMLEASESRREFEAADIRRAPETQEDRISGTSESEPLETWKLALPDAPEDRSVSAVQQGISSQTSDVSKALDLSPAIIRGTIGSYHALGDIVDEPDMKLGLIYGTST